MIYVCNQCHEEIEDLRTDGDDRCDGFVCVRCAGQIKAELKKVTDRMATQVNSTYHIR